MILAFDDDTTISILADSAEANREYEAVDVEEGSVTFFRDDGTPLRPRFSKPIRRLWSGLVVQQDEFTLEPAPEASGGDAILDALARATMVNPNPRFASVEAVRKHVIARRQRVGDEVV